MNYNKTTLVRTQIFDETGAPVLSDGNDTFTNSTTEVSTMLINA